MCVCVSQKDASTWTTEKRVAKTYLSLSLFQNPPTVKRTHAHAHTRTHTHAHASTNPLQNVQKNSVPSGEGGGGGGLSFEHDKVFVAAHGGGEEVASLQREKRGVVALPFYLEGGATGRLLFASAFSVSLYLSVSLSHSVSVSISLSLSVSLSPSICLSRSLFLSLSPSLSLSLSISLSIALCLLLSLCHFLSINTNPLMYLENTHT